MGPDWQAAQSTTQRGILGRIEEQFGVDDDIDPEQVARAVFMLLQNRVADGEIEDVKHVLPAEIRDLWPSKRTGGP